MDTFEELVIEASENRANVELLCEQNPNGGWHFGARLRFWSKDMKGMMAIAEGSTFGEAVALACNYAANGRTRPVDFAYRPWANSQSAGKWRVGQNRG